jgi:hypothetical protein
MNTRPLLLVLSLALMAAGARAQQIPSRTNVFELVPVVERFNAQLRDAAVAGTQTVENIRSGYSQALSRLEKRLQQSGTVADLLAVQSEKKRFEHEREVPTQAVVNEPADLRALQGQCASRLESARRAAAQQVSALFERHLKELAALQKRCEDAQNPVGLRRVWEERTRTLNLAELKAAAAVLREQQAAAATRPTPSAVATNRAAGPGRPVVPVFKAPDGASYKLYAPGAEPQVPSKEMKALRLSPAPATGALGFSYYGLEVALHTKQDLKDIEVPMVFHLNRNGTGAPDFVPRIRQPGTDFYMERVTLIQRGEEGDAAFIPRVKVTARNRAIEEGTLLVIQYFARPKGGSVSERTCTAVRHIPLPALDRGVAVLVEDAGINLWSQEYQYEDAAGSRYGRRQMSGEEFYGLIVGLFKADGSPLLLAGSSQPLAKSAVATLSNPLDALPATVPAGGRRR